jgi:hypothetical protein
MDNVKEFLAGIDGCQFVGIRSYRNAKGELADYVIAAGFSYMNLVEKRLSGLAGIEIPAVLARCAGRLDKDGMPITAAAVETAITDLRASYQRTLDGVSQWSAADVFEPVTVNGVTVRCAKTYTGSKAAEPGTVYLSGLIVRKTVIEAAPFPKAAPKSRADVIAKGAIEAMLPGGSIVSFKVTPEQVKCLNAHGETLDLSAL